MAQIFYANNGTVMNRDTALAASWVRYLYEIMSYSYSCFALDHSIADSAHEPQLWLPHV